MGFALSERALAGGHQVVLIAGPTALQPPSAADYRPVVSALEMRDQVRLALAESQPRIEVVVMVAAVADYRPATREAGKPRKSDAGLSLNLVPNPDILRELGQDRAADGSRVVLVGFALEAGGPEEIVAKGKGKLERKGVDLIVVNHVRAMGAEDNEVTLVFRAGVLEGEATRRLGRMNKSDVAQAILAAALEILEAAGRQGSANVDGKRGKTQ